MAALFALWLARAIAFTALAPPSLSPSASPSPSIDRARPIHRARVVIVTLGFYAPEWLDAVERELRDELQVDVVVAGERWLSPDDAYDFESRTWDADAILRALDKQAPGALLLALTDVPLRVRDDVETGPNGAVAGRANLELRDAVASVAEYAPYERMWPTRYRFGAAATAVHEVAHLLGLAHCGDPACVMFAGATGRNTADASHLCARCRRELLQNAPPVL